jgi:hypothetical protein
MPNHVESNLCITGDIKTIDKMLERYGGEVPIDANKIIPYPKEFAESDKASKEAHERARRGEITFEEAYRVKDGYSNGGKGWCVENWGTKWPLYEFTPLVKTSNGVQVGFQSAWEPPLPIIKRMSEHYPELLFTLTYIEEFNGFSGVYKVQEGEVILDECF